MKKYTLNFPEGLIYIDSPQVMGILNITPDSFFDGGKFTDRSSAMKQTSKMVSDGATFIDVGACSTRPGAAFPSEEEELYRLIPILKELKKEFQKIIFSVDTFRSEVARQAIDCGAGMVNDISAGEMDKNMFQTIAKLKVPYVLMHMQGTPETMQDNPIYENVTVEIFRYLGEKISTLKNMGVTDIILDPGFGFGKSVEHNFELLRNLNVFESLDAPILVGLSRKSMVNRILKTKPENAINGTTVVNTMALMNGASILRVHDVKEAMETVKLFSALRQTNSVL